MSAAAADPRRPARTKRYREALAWLASFADEVRGVGWNPRSTPSPEWNVRRTRTLLDLAGAPDRGLTIVLIAGTNGKGSTAALLASVIGASGVRTGLYTQPHLQSERERVRVDGAAIAEATFTKLAGELEPSVGELRRSLPEAGEPTAFELGTVLALRAFDAAGCAVAVLEVGLGGRLDATNATDPHVSVITSVGHDHMAILGTRLSTIAREKAGIVRAGQPALVARQRSAARAAIRAECARIGASYREIAPLTRAAAARYRLSLRGPHQRQNAALAIAAARALAEYGVAAPSERSIAKGLARVRWPGRFEVVRGEPPIVLDGAHNAEAAAALARTLRERFPGRRVRLVTGMLRDKDAAAFARALRPTAAAVYATQPRGPRALAANALARHYPRSARGAAGRAETRRFSTLAEALVVARADARDREVICVTGSLALVGEARELLGLGVPERLWE